MTISADGSATLTIATTNDEADEADGDIFAAIEGDDGYVVSASAGEAAVAVADDDPAPTEEQQPTSELSDDDDPSSEDEQQPKPEVSVTGGSGITEGGSATFTISVNPAPDTPAYCQSECHCQRRLRRGDGRACDDNQRRRQCHPDHCYDGRRSGRSRRRYIRRD